MRIVSFAAALAAVVLSSTTAQAQRAELGVSTGGHWFADDIELGADDVMDAPGIASSGLLGVRAAIGAARLAAEGELVVVPTADDVLDDAATVFGARAHGVVHVLTGRVRPFVVAGAGLFAVRGGAPQLDDDVDPALHWGGGVKIGMTRRLDVRIDVRHLIIPDRSPRGATHDLELSAGLSWRIGGTRSRPPARIAAEPPPPAPPRRPPPPPVPEPEPEPEPEVVVDLAGVQFDRDSWALTAASKEILERAVDVLTARPELVVEVAGHTSSDGDHDANVALSLRRAEAVRDYLIRRGIDADRLTAVGYGPDRPIGDEATEEGRARNRRIELRVIGAITAR